MGCLANRVRAHCKVRQFKCPENINIYDVLIALVNTIVEYRCAINFFYYLTSLYLPKKNVKFYGSCFYVIVYIPKKLLRYFMNDRSSLTSALSSMMYEKLLSHFAYYKLPVGKKYHINNITIIYHINNVTNRNIVLVLIIVSDLYVRINKVNITRKWIFQSDHCIDQLTSW